MSSPVSQSDFDALEQNKKSVREKCSMFSDKQPQISLQTVNLEIVKCLKGFYGIHFEHAAIFNMLFYRQTAVILEIVQRWREFLKLRRDEGLHIEYHGW